MQQHDQQHPPGCLLEWVDISKMVEIREKSKGLMRRSISRPQRTQQTLKNHNNKKKVILNKVSGSAHPGQVLAIMGPSGSGKTSLLDVLAGRSAHNGGEIIIRDGITNQTTFSSLGRRGSTVKQLKRRIAYITQADSFFGHLTVRDQLTYTALLRLPPTLSTAEKHAEVHRILSLFRLHKCADTQIRLVSGGEKKRVNIGTELLTDPLLVLLDEPTTGLDSTSANALLHMLVGLARSNAKTIVTSLHQPSSTMYQLFDSVLWLADACVVYHGTPMDSISYLTERGYECPRGHNIADHWMDLLVEDTALHGGTLHSKSELNTKANDEERIEQERQCNEGTNNTGDTVGESVDGAAPARRSGWGRMQSSRRRSSVLESQLEQSLADLITKDTPKAMLIVEWRDQRKTTSTQPQVESTRTIDSVPETNKSKAYNTSWLTQFYVLTHRCMKNSRSAIFTVLNIVKSCCLGVMAGLLWFQMPYREEYVVDRSSYFFFTMTFWLFDSLFGALLAFPAERSVVLKERASGSYHLSAYFLAKTLSEAPVRLALPFIYLVISYWMAGINNRVGIFFATLGINLMSVLAGESIGLLVGATVLDFEKAMALLVVLSVMLMVAGGYYIDNIPSFMQWFQYLSPFTYAYNGSVQLAFDRDVPCDDSTVLEVVCGQPGVDYATPDQVLEFLGVSGTIGFNVGLLFVLIVVPRTMAFWALKLKKGEER